MPLIPGVRFGPYEVTAKIGAGGMGEVYRATDTRLKREVALKILPSTFASDPERMARFQREAELLASLNHPNIAQIHGLEDGASPGDSTRALVMELVEGPTLADRLILGALPVDEALSVARQIADALDVAHEQGIVHRDLKPANIKLKPRGAHSSRHVGPHPHAPQGSGLSPRGEDDSLERRLSAVDTADCTVKVLDFGLAKAVEPRVSSPDLANSPTLTVAATSAGVIMGTAAYMSPEQAKGRHVDRRADIFAFGCVLFEMLSGKPTFGGDGVAEILAHVLTREPAWDALPSGVSPRLQELLRDCLQKDVRKRRRSAGDLVIEIDRIASAPAATVAPAVAARSARTGWIAAAVCLAIATAAIAFALRPEASREEMRLSLVTPPQGAGEFAISPDGTNVAMAGLGGQTVWLRRLDRPEAQPLSGVPQDARFPFWAPDSRSVIYWSAGKLWRLDPAGGPGVVLAEVGTSFSGAAVSKDGTIIFSNSLVSPLFRAAGAGAPPEAITHLEATRAYGHLQPRFLPDGQHFLFFATGGPDVQGVYLGSLDASAPTRLTAADGHGEFLEPGYVVYVSQGALMARRLDLGRRALTGDAQVVAESVSYTAAIGRGAFSVSATGRIVYRASASDRRRLTWYDRATKLATPVADPDSNGREAAELSPDGRQVAIDRTVQGNRDIWLLDLARGSMPRFTFDAAQDGMPVWSPDSRQVAYESKRKGPFDLYVKEASGSGVERPLLESPYDKWPMDWSKDSAYVLYYESNPKTYGDLRALPMTRRDRTDETIPIAATAFEESFGQFSPDARWVAYQTNESGRFEIVVQSFPTPSVRRQMSRDGGTQPRWSRDGKELYFVGPDSTLLATRLEISAASVEPAAPVALFRWRLAGVPKHQYSVAADGRFLVNEIDEDVASSLLTVVLNWKPK